MSPKTLFLILIVFQNFINLAQSSFIGKIWVGNNGTYLRADSSIIRFETFSKAHGNTSVVKHYYLIGDTLRILEQEFPSKIYSDFLFDIIQKKTLSLIPLNNSASYLSNLITLNGAQKELRFVDQSIINRKNVEFEKILFNATECYGRCPSMSLEIDQNKKVRFIGIAHTPKKGCFSASLTDELFKQLIEILNLAELDQIQCKERANIDLASYTLEIHYNEKILYLKTCDIPFILDELMNFLLHLPEKIDLTVSENPFTIHFQD